MATPLEAFLRDLWLSTPRVGAWPSCTLEWSNGQPEGQITRLKLLKRKMYGRAQDDLFRQRARDAA